MKYRIEIKFEGDAPEDELSRAIIIGDEKVRALMADLSAALKACGFEHGISARSVQVLVRRKKAGSAPVDPIGYSQAAE